MSADTNHGPLVRKVFICLGIGIFATAALWLLPFYQESNQPFSDIRWLQSYALRLWLPVWCIAVLMLSGVFAAFKSRWLRRPLAYARYNIIEFGGGFYGTVALATFLSLEANRIAEQFAEWQTPDSGWVPALVMEVIDFSIDSIMNGIWAMVWPAFHNKAFAANFWPALGLAAGLYFLAEWLFSSRRKAKATAES